MADVARPIKAIPHVEVQRNVAVFRSALADCSPAVQQWVALLSEKLALRLLGSSGNLSNMTAAVNYAHAIIAEAVIKAKNCDILEVAN